MPLRFPDFKDKKCHFLSLCGSVVTEDDKPIKELAHDLNWMIAKYSKSRRTVFIRAGLGSDRTTNHVHMDLAPKELFSKGDLPKRTHKPEEVQQAVAFLAGKSIDVEIEGDFRVVQADLPPLITSTLVETKAGDVVIRMTGGTLSVRGAPIHTIRWTVPSEGTEARVTLRARTKMPFDDTYLEKSLALLESAFSAFILENPRNA